MVARPGGYLSKPWFSDEKHGDEHPHSSGGRENPKGQGKQNTEHGAAQSDCSNARSCGSCSYHEGPLWVPCPACKYPHLAMHATVHGTCSRQSTNSIPQGYCHQVAEAGAVNSFSGGATEVQPDGALPSPRPPHRPPGAPDLLAPRVEPMIPLDWTAVTLKDPRFSWEAPSSPGSPKEWGPRPHSPPLLVLTRYLLCAQPVLGTDGAERKQTQPLPSGRSQAEVGRGENQPPWY